MLLLVHIAGRRVDLKTHSCDEVGSERVGTLVSIESDRGTDSPVGSDIRECTSLEAGERSLDELSCARMYSQLP